MLVIYRLMTTPQVLRSGAWNTTVPVPPDESLGNSRFGPLAISLVKSLLTLDTGQTLIRMRHCRFGDSNNFQSCCTSLNPSWIARCLLGIALAMGWLQRKDSPITGMSAVCIHIHLPCSHSYCTVCIIYIYIYYIYIFSRCGEKRKASPFLFVNSPTSVRSHGEGVVETLANCLGFQRCQLEACQGGSDCWSVVSCPRKVNLL